MSNDVNMSNKIDIFLQINLFIIVIPEKIEQIELTPIFGSTLLFEPFWMGVYNLGPPDS